MYVRPLISGTQGRSIFARYVPDLQLSVKQHGASDEAVAEATALMKRIFLGLSPTNAGLLRGLPIELHIIPHGKQLTDIADFRKLRGKTTPDGQPYESLRGTGGMRSGSRIVYAAGEETLVRIDGVLPYYHKGYVVAHETGHVVARFALTKSQQQILQNLFDERRRTAGDWIDVHAGSSAEAYFSSSTAAMFGHPRRNMVPDVARFTRGSLYQNDPRMHRLLSEVFMRAPGPIPD
jgi:hypothetical protein